MAIDFNHSSGVVPTGERDLSAVINEQIDAALARKKSKEPERDYLGASQIGEPCARKLCYMYAKTPVDPGKEIGGKVLRIFDLGHHIEDWVGLGLKWMTDAGFKMRIADKQGKQFGFSLLGGKIQGHIDGVILGVPKAIPLQWPAGWECKGLNTKGWSQMRRHGVKVANETYYGQMQMMMAYMDLSRFLFTCINKNTCEMYHEIVEFDPARAQRVSDRGADVIRAVEGGTLLERIAANKDFFRCKFCSYSARCWGEK